MTTPKYQIGQLVFKWTGDYGGPGVVRGIAVNAKGQTRYMVGHTIDGGFGEFLHIYAEGNLRECEMLSDLPNVTMAQGLAARTGRPTPDEVQVGHPSPVAGHNTVALLLEALVEAHRQVDTLLAMAVKLDKKFMPSQSELWPEVVRRAELIRTYGWAI